MIKIKKEDAKRNLVNLGYLDNEYLDKYLEIIYNNLETPKSVHTQKHHILPVKNYDEESLVYNRLTAVKKANEDKQNFLVNLLYKDHLTAHAYLTLCTNLDLAQAKYDRQADIRKRNSQVGLKAVRLKYRKHKIATDKSSKNKQR